MIPSPHRETLKERACLDRSQSVVTQRASKGVRLLVKRYPAAPVVTIWAWIGVGSVNELPEEAGLSHVLEHMAFKGTRRRGRGEISRFIEAHGGVINAFTGYYATAYYISLPREHLELGVDLLADVLCNSVFDPEELERELAVIGEEIRMRDDRPDSRIWELVTSSVFQKHLLGRPIAGYHQTVQAFTRAQVVNHYRRHYTPANTRLTVVGDVDPVEVAGLVDKHFAAYDRPDVVPRTSPPEPRQRGHRLKIEEMNLARARLALAWPTVAQLHSDAPALDVLANILGDGRSSRLYRRLKEELKLVDDIESISYTGNDVGLFVVEAELDAGNIPEVVAVINGEVELLRNHPVGPYEVGRVLNSVELEYLEAHETTEGQAQEICYYDQLGDWKLADSYLNNLYTVDATRLREVAICYLAADTLNVALITPPGQAEALADLEPGCTEGRPPSRRRPLPERPPQIVIPEPSAGEELELENGLRVVLYNNANVAQTALAALTRGGVYEEPEEARGITNLSLELLQHGTCRRAAEAFHSQLEFYGTGLDSFLRRDFYGLRLNCASRHLDPCLKLFCEALTEPAFPADHLPQVREDTLNRIASRSEDAVGYCLGRANIVLHGGRGYGRFLVGEAETVAGLERSSVAAWYRRRLCGRRQVVGVAGGFEREALLELLGDLTVDICSGDDPPPPPEPVYHAERFEESLPKQQTHIALAHPAPDQHSSSRFAAVVLAQALSGSGSRLFLNLRDVRHLAYLVFFSYSPLNAGGAFFSYLATSPGRGDEALEALREELTRAADGGISAAEVEDAKRHLVGLFKLGRQRNATVLAAYAEAAASGKSILDVEAFPERIAAVDADEVNALAADYLGRREPAVYLLRGTLPRRDSMPR
jgi:zinc protease